MVGVNEVHDCHTVPGVAGGPAPKLSGTYNDVWADGLFEPVADFPPPVEFLDMCSWDGAVSMNSPRLFSHSGALGEQDLQVDDVNEMDSALPQCGRLNERGGQKRPPDTNTNAERTRKVARNNRALAGMEVPQFANEIRSEHLIKLLSDDEFRPGARPDLIKRPTVPAGTMFKETPKRRRPHATQARPLDKWYNTGGIKTASDRFPSTSNLGLRKRYGKIVRDGLPLLRFHEYTLISRNPLTDEVSEVPNGACLFHMVPETQRASPIEAQKSAPALKLRMKQLQKMRAREALLQRRLAELRQQIRQSAGTLREIQHNIAKRTYYQ